ncbi:hypothetical protein BU26DRAFT_524470 [Trematosphaeria pertusa]|uniref:Copper acquisition factor BIM1-like domain-containing protein n=1 Tax=Trematosphaeria pertusa TaxID=390896 RepID=A0A6A6HWA7_9PLEO|nr:uncharacterized protein BU26DRAFT_524470 [Trematosphaeria pertusa]KAF2242317.1 hypothetical protein BU26DRAFT_524470 [Trematosphaeria pertusa]
MLSTIALLPFLGLAAAHFRLLEPTWRGDSFADGASQWLWPCANVSETTDIANRTQWPLTGGSLVINGSHPWALTYVNLGLSTNVTNFNISLVDNFNQTGKGVLCLKETGRAALEEGLRESNISVESLDGMQASVQVIQISHSGASLYNCADITFNASAALLSDDECKNGTGVAGGPVQNADSAPTPTGSAGPSESTGAAVAMMPGLGGGVLAGMVAWALL